MKKVLALVLALCMTLCVAQAAMADMLSDIQEKGTLVVGANVGFPPYEFYYTNPETGEEELQGFDMKPVSYTHLDVYKRQVGRCRNFIPQ